MSQTSPDPNTGATVPAHRFGSPPLQSIYFLSDVLALGDRQAVVTSRDLYSSTHVKLVNRGVHLTSSMFERIVRHKLLVPIEECVVVERGVRPESLGEDARALLAPDGAYAVLASRVAHGALVGSFSVMPLPAPIAVKLTIAKEQRARLYEHSVEVALLSVYLSARLGGDNAELIHAASAGVLHDLGELHLAPHFLDPKHQLASDEYEFLYSHPVAGYLIAEAYPEYPAAVRNAVLQHHERLDGSGYPRGLRQGDISPLGEIVAAAEVGSVLIRRTAQLGVAAYMEVPLRMMLHKLNPRLIGLLSELLQLQPDDANDQPAPDHDQQRHQLQVVADVLLDWERTKAVLVANDGVAGDEILQFMTVRLEQLHRSLLATGFDPRDVNGFVELLDDDRALRSEMAAIAREAHWGFLEVMLETRRRWSEFATAPEASRSAVADWLARAGAHVRSRHQ